MLHELARRAILVRPEVDLDITSGSALVAEVTAEGSASPGLVPLVTALDPEVGRRALQFFSLDISLLADPVMLARSAGLESPAVVSLVLEQDPARMFLEAGPMLCQPATEMTVRSSGWDLFCALLEYEAVGGVLNLPPYDSRLVYRHLLACRADNPLDAGTFLRDQLDCIEDVRRQEGGGDPVLAIMAEDIRMALSGDLARSVGYSVVVPVYRQQLLVEGTVRAWQDAGAVEVVVAFGLGPTMAAAVYVEVARSPARFVRPDVRNDPALLKEVIGVPRIVADDSLSWPVVDFHVRRNFGAYEKMRQALGADRGPVERVRLGPVR